MFELVKQQWLLWFVENFLSLHRHSHLCLNWSNNSDCCDLSKISYLCTDIHTYVWIGQTTVTVVICRKFLIFAQTFTPMFELVKQQWLLWFVENFLSLHRHSHQENETRQAIASCDLSKISYLCTDIHTTPDTKGINDTSCDLSKISYLCTDIHTTKRIADISQCVVICRKFLIFAQTFTPIKIKRRK